MTSNVTMQGRLTRDPELRQAQSGTYVCKFSLALNDREPDGQGGWQDRASYIDCVCFGKRAEKLAEFFSKGRPMLVYGRLQQDRWEDRETGQKRSALKVVVNDWHFVLKDAQDQQGGGHQASGGGGGGGGEQHRQSVLDGDSIPF